MNPIKKTYTTIKQNLPRIIQPQNHSFEEQFLSHYAWALQKRNKTIGIGWDTYYTAMNNVWINACIQTYIDEIINLGFMIKNPESNEVDIVNTQYLTQLFNNPMGLRSNDTFATYNTVMWKSFLGLGDTFSEVVHDPEYTNVPIGLNYIPAQYMKYFQDTSQWGYIDDSHRFEPSDIIHIKNPGIKGQLWGESYIDVLAKDITLEILGRDFTKEILENKGLDPAGVLEYDADIDDVTWNQEISRLQTMSEKNRRGTMIIRGGSYKKSGITTQDMEFKDLMKDVRDRVLATYGVPPQKISIIEVANLGSGSGESQNKQFKKTLKGKARLFEDAFKKVLGRSTFKETFFYNDLDIEDKLVRAQIENIRIQNGSLTVNEVREGYGQEPLEIGDETINNNDVGMYKKALFDEGLISL